MEWLSAKPLDGFSSLHEGLLWNFCGLRIGHFSGVISFNVATGLSHESALTLHSRSLDRPMLVPHVDFRIEELTQWELDLTPYQSFKEYLEHLNYKQRYNHCRTEKCFADYGCKVTVIKGDWSDYAGESV